MNYKIDVLIIHSPDDNPADRKNVDSWVTSFQKYLSLLLKQLLGTVPNILTRSDKDKITAANYKEIAVLIPVVSPSFLKSKEHHQFMNIFSEDKKRVFKVIKQPVEETELLRELTTYDLTEFDPEQDFLLKNDDFESKKNRNNSLMRLTDLAYDISEELKILQQKDRPAPVKSLLNNKAIYLAETAEDVSIQRNYLKRLLNRQGFTILPDQAISGSIDKAKKYIHEQLEKASLSIHLTGNDYGNILIPGDRSITDLQYHLAAEKSKSSGDFHRLVWINPELSDLSDKQKTFLENLQRENDTLETATIFQTSFEEFKNVLQEELDLNAKKIQIKGEPEKANKPLIYILHDRIDSENVKPIIRFIEKSGYKVLTPSFSGALVELRQEHISYLQQFDAAIIYQNNVNDQWVKMKLLDLLKAPGFGRKKPVKGRAILTEKDPKHFRAATPSDVVLIGGETENKIDSLKEFLKLLN